MIVRVDEPRDHELAGGLDDLDPVVGRDVRRDPLDDGAADQEVGGCGLVDVAVVVVDPSAADVRGAKVVAVMASGLWRG